MAVWVHWHDKDYVEKILDAHYYNGNIQKHHNLNIAEKLTKENLYENTIIIKKEDDHKKLAVKEAYFQCLSEC